MSDLDAIILERGKVYGDARENWEGIAQMWAPIMAPWWERIRRREPVPPHVAVLMMTLVKISRTRLVYHPDNYPDAANYLRFAEEWQKGGPEPPSAHRPAVYLSGPITGEPADWVWRKQAARLLAACGLGVLDPLRDAEHGDVSGNGGLLRGEPVPADRAHRDLGDVRQSVAVLAHFPYNPARQSIGTLMELGMAAAMGKPVVLVADGDMAAHPFVRAFARVAPTLAEGVALVAANVEDRA